nr:hypothetical protein [Tanacetum cinerariifolium]
MNLLNRNCIHCIYGDEKPVTCSACEGMLRGGFCLPCNLKPENSFICYQNAYSFNDTSNNSNYLPQPQCENYLCNLCGNNSHDGYDCQQQFSLVYEQEPSYNQNYNDNYYPHDLPSFPCDNCGGSHTTFQCQPMDQSFDFSGSDQIQTPQHPDIHPPSQKIRDEVFQAKGDLMKSIQTFLEEFNYIAFGEKPKILLQAWDKFFASQHAQLEDSNELFQKLLKDLHIIKKELIECNHPTFFDNDEDHLENSSKEIAFSNSNQEKEKPPQDFDIRQLIREECFIEVSEEQKHNMENTILEMVEISRQKELYRMNDNEVKNVVEQPTERRNRIIASLQNFRVIHKSSTFMKNTSQISPVHAVTPILSIKEPEYSPSMGYEHPNTTPETESDEIIKSGVEELVPILSENEVTSEDKKECDVPVCENSPICDDHSEIFSDSKNDDDISSDDDAFEDMEYVEASLPDQEIVSVEEENDVHQEEEETRSDNTTTHADDSLPEYDSFCFEIEPDQERLINVVKNDISNDSTNDPLLEEADLFLASDNSIPPGIKNFAYDSEGDTRFLEELLIDDSSPNNEESDFDNPSFPRPPPEPPDVDFGFKPDAGEEISVVMNDNDEFEYLNPRDEFDVSNDDYFPFMFDSKVFSLLLFAESEDTIFDPEIPSGEIKVHIEVLSVLWGNRLPIRTVRCRCLAFVVVVVAFWIATVCDGFEVVLLWFGVENLADYNDDELPIPFRRWVFLSSLDGEHIVGNMVLRIIEDELFDRLHDDDAISLCCLGILQLVLLCVEGKRRIPYWMLRLENDRVGWDNYS